MKRAASANERGLWLIHMMAPESPVYNCQMGIELSEPVSIANLHRSLDLVTRKHPGLRATFGEESETVTKYVSPMFSSKQIQSLFECISLTHTALESAIIKDARKPFDLSVGPLFRCYYYFNDSDLRYISFVFHHIICDGIALNVLERDIVAFLSASSLRECSAEDALNESDFVYEEDVPSDTEAALGFWQEHLAGSPLQIDLPFDKERIEGFTGENGARASISIDADRLSSLRAVARELSVPLSSLTLASYFLLLNYFGAGEDLIVGVASANRPDERYFDEVSFRASALPVRQTIAASDGLIEFIRRVHRAMGDAVSNSHYDFEELVRRINPTRSFGKNPLFQSMFVFQQRLENRKGNELLFRRHDADIGITRFPLSLRVTEAKEVLTFEFEYSKDHFSERRIQQLHESLESILDTFSSQTDITVSQLEPFPLSDRKFIEDCQGARRSDALEGALLHELIEQQVGRTPDSIAICASFDVAHEELTYRVLDNLSNQFANFLVANDYAPRKPVSLLLESSVERVIAMIGTLKAGGFYVPLSTENPKERLEKLFSKLNPALIIVGSSIELGNLKCPILDTQTFWEAIVGFSESKPNIDISPKDSAYLIYTSGSSGEPKGVEVSHRSIVNHELWFSEVYQVTAGDRTLQRCPYFYDGSINEFYAPLIRGACLYLSLPGKEVDIAQLIATIISNKIRFLTLVPSLLTQLIDEPSFSQCSSLRVIICGGEAMPIDLPSRFSRVLPNASLENLYGPTEATINVTSFSCVNHKSEVVPIGKAIWNTDLHVVDHFGRMVPVGIPGELQIAGVALAKGYYQEPRLTEEKFIFAGSPQLERRYRTGDLVQWEPGGNLLYLGRIDRQVKINGHRIEPSEIEFHMREFPGITSAVVLKIDSQFESSFLVGFYCAGSEKDVSRSECSTYLEAQLPFHMVPGYLVQVESMPLTPAGKVDTEALRRIFWQSRTDENKASTACDLIEYKIAALCERVLGFKLSSTSSDFFLAGGTSLHAIRLVSEFSRLINFKIDIRDFYKCRTIERLAARYIETQRSSQLPEKKTTERKPRRIVFIHTLAGEIHQYIPLMNLLENDLTVDVIVPSTALKQRASLLELADDYIDEHLELFSGEFSLLGWSFGGVLAYAIVARLERRGIAPAHLFLLDSRPPELFRERDADLSGSLINSALIMLKEIGIDNPSKEEILSDGTIDREREWFLSNYRSKRKLPIHLEAFLLQKLEMSARFYALMQTVSAVVIKCPATFFSAQMEDSSARKAEAWRDLLMSGSEVSVPTTHYGMVDAANAEFIAAAIRSILSATCYRSSHITEFNYGMEL